MSKSWGNSIEFNEAADRIGVDVMRWMFAKARPEDNILFGYQAADEARRELLILWNVYSFFVTYGRLAGWRPTRGIDEEIAGAASWTALDRWILSRAAGLAADVGARLIDFDALGASRAVSTYIDDLSTWYLRRSRDRMRAAAAEADRIAAFATLHAALVSLTRTMAPILPFLSEAMYQNLMVSAVPSSPDSVHLTAWPADVMAPHRDEKLEAAMAVVRRVVELARTLRGQAGLRLRQPLARMWLALPAGTLSGGDQGLERELLALLAEEVNVKDIVIIGDESELVARRVKPLLPVIGPRLGSQVPAVMAAARAGEVEYLDGGGVRLAGVELAADEVEILATPRPGTEVAHDEGVVVVIDTAIDDALRAEGDARELVRAVQDLRKHAGMALDDLIELWLDAPPEVVKPLEPHLARVARDTLAAEMHREPAPAGVPSASQAISGGVVGLAIRGRRDGAGG